MEDLLAKVERLLALLEAKEAIPLREIHTRAEACALLGGISLKTLDRMVRKGLISACHLGMKPRGGIPRSEIQRLATPAAPQQKPPSARRAPPSRAERTAKDEAAAIRAALKRR